MVVLKAGLTVVLTAYTQVEMTVSALVASLVKTMAEEWVAWMAEL